MKHKLWQLILVFSLFLSFPLIAFQSCKNENETVVNSKIKKSELLVYCTNKTTKASTPIVGFDVPDNG